jgi:hypothetical protein
MPGVEEVAELMARFLAAHGYDPGPTQRPLLAGALSGAIATIPASVVLWLFGSLQVEARILAQSLGTTLGAGVLVMAMAGSAYARLFGRAANDRRGGWLFGAAFGFGVWAAGAVLILPIASGGIAPAGEAALGLFLSLVLWGLVLGLLVPLVHRPLHASLNQVSKQPESGPAASASANRGPTRGLDRRV